ncbi:phenol hydroxylase subunit [Pseudothauera rhizosphaerae]|uniref:phenol hydroxylase subunit n=1 Tax=Pseudothauera rhizosphaerae TaxID=2565932 RepID=UPI001E3B9C0E|nr:phenol hydroxylase subunit [Pseudothauera rhizosphaerae]
MQQLSGLIHSRRYVRVTGNRPGGFIEFDFAIGDPELFVELILPQNAFEEFCARNRAVVLTSSSEHCADGEMGWRLRDVVDRVAGGPHEA